MSEYWKRAELPRMGTQVRSLIEFSGVPKGTTGRVIDSWQIGTGTRDEWGVMIMWNRHPGDKLSDGFSKKDYDRFLEVV